MSSTRLPGKVLLPIVGRPMLTLLIERLRHSKLIDRWVVATSIEIADDPIEAHCSELGVDCFRGSMEDVLDRYYRLAMQYEGEIIVRVTADDPLKDPVVIDKVITHFQAHPELDYASNTIEPTYPEGLDVEVFSFRALEKAWHEAALPSEREHVTPYIWKHSRRFRIANVRHQTDLSSLRWTVDYEEDLQFIREVYKRLYKGDVFYMEDILALLESEPQLGKINADFERNAGYFTSLKEDRQ